MKLQIALVILAISLSFAQDRLEPRRKVQYQINNDGVNFQMEAESADDSSNSKISFIMKGTSNGFFCNFKYESSKDRPLEYSANLLRIIEFVPKSGEAFNPSTDVPASVFVPNQYKKATVETKTSGTVTTYDFTLETSNGVFAVIGHIVTDTRRNGTVVYSPNSVKLDYLIRNWSYKQNGTKLALESRIQTKDDCRERREGSTDRVEINGNAGGRIKGTFTWKPTVDADGVSVDVLKTTLDKSPDQNVTRREDTEYRLFHTFNTVNRVKIFNWDPSIGATSSSTIVKLSLGMLLIVFTLFY